MAIKYSWMESHDLAPPLPPLLAPSKKGLLLAFTFAKKRTYLDTQLKGDLTNLFFELPDVPFSHRQSRNRMISTFIIVNITPHLRDILEDKLMLVHSKNAYLLPSVWPGIEDT